MSLIRKPDIEVFRDSGTVTALRGAKALVQEGGRGAARTVSTLWLSMMIVVFIMCGLGAIASARSLSATLLILPMLGAAVWWLCHLWRAPTREGALQDGDTPLPTDIAVPLPEHLRLKASGDGFHINYWPRAFVNKATLLVIGGYLVLAAPGSPFGMLTWLGLLMVARALLLFSLFFGGGTCVRASKDRLTVRSLLGEKSMLWSDVLDVRIRKCDRDEYWQVLSTGSRDHIVVTGHHRLGSGELLIPYKLLGLDQAGVADLTRRIFMRKETARAAGWSAVPAPTESPAPRNPFAQEESRSGFDPDAIIRRYLEEREQTAAVPEMPPVRCVAGFGRKRLG